MDSVEIDGSYGEGGGSILRVALPLAAVAGKKVSVTNIRANRPKPGLKMQHVVGAKAVKWLSNAKTTGLELDSKAITFEPTKLQGGNFSLNIQTAGSITLLLQSVMPLAPFLPSPLSARIQGGTDVSWSPPFDFLKHVLFPVLNKSGYSGSVEAIKRGYFPQGGGIVTGKASPVKFLKPFDLVDFGEVDYVEGVAHCVNYPGFTGKDAASAAKSVLNDSLKVEASIALDCKEKVVSPSRGLGVVLWAVTSTNAKVSSSALMSKDLPTAEAVGELAAKNLLLELDRRVPVDSFLQDQLLVYMALAQGRSHLLTHPLTDHAKTNIWTIEQLLDVKFKVSSEEVHGKEAALVSVEGAAQRNAFLS